MHNDTVQQKAVLHLAGPMLLIAGPGSGKTTVITKRIQNLIACHGISPYRILVITFTRAAAEEMKTRSARICPQAAGAAFGTFHSVFYHILRHNPRFRDFTLLHTTEKEKILQGLLMLYGIQKKDLRVCMEELERLLALVKNSGVKFELLQTPQAEELWNKAQIGSLDADKKERYCKLLVAYREECVLRKKLDFDDMLVYCKEILTEDIVFRQEWQDRFSHILVDEFQDINTVQYEVLQLLGKEPYNLFAVGDDDQAIYGFRGSDPSFMRRFQEDFPGCVTLYMTNNYRSSREIVDAAGRCISHNHNRFSKEIVAVSREKGDFAIKRFADRSQEDAWLTDACRQSAMWPGARDRMQGEMYSKNISGVLKDMQTGILGEMTQDISGNVSRSVAILVRTNQSVAYYEALLRRADISGDGTKEAEASFEESWHKETVQDILAILRFAMGERDRELFFRFMNKPQRGISRIAVGVEVFFSQLKQIYGHNEQMVQTLVRLEQELMFLADLPPFGAVQYIISVMGFGKYVQTCDCSREKERACMMRTLEEMKERARAFVTLPDYVQWLQMWERTNAEKNGIGKGGNGNSGRNSERNSERDSIQVMTYHGAKGLEFDTVFLPDVRDGVVPRGRILTQEELEEERRMFYVAMTRAKRNLYISYSGDTQADDRQSIFVCELTEPGKK